MEPTYPSLSERAQFVFADTVVIVLLMFAAGRLLDSMTDPPDWLRIVLFFGIWGIYEPVCTAFACTIGQAITGLRTRRHSNYEKRIGLPAAFLRYLVKMLLGWLAFITISSNPERRAIHDFAAGSVMLKLGK